MSSIFFNENKEIINEKENPTVIDKKKNKDFSYLLKLDKLKFKDIKVKRVPGIQEINHKEIGKCFALKYFIINDKGTFLVRFLSKKKNFKTLDVWDLCDYKFKPLVGHLMKDDTSPEVFLEFLGQMFVNLKKQNKVAVDKAIKEHYEKTTSNNVFIDEKINFEYYFSKYVGMASLVISAILYGIVMYQLISFWVKKYFLYKEEKHAETTVEDRINNELFLNQKKDEPVFSIYSELIKFIELVSLGKLKSLIVYGKPGTGKTYVTKRTFHFNKLKPGKDYTIAKGSSLGLSETYQLFYDNKDKIIVLDDFDTPLKNNDMINMLKALTDSYKERVLSLPREKIMQTGQDLRAVEAPDKFVFNGKLIIITNLAREEIDRALLSRSPAVEVNFSTNEVIQNLEDMMKFIHPDISMEMKQEVLDYILDLRKKDANIEIDFRAFQSAVEVRYCIPETWKEMIKVIVNYKGK
jgi:hypothetical protein